MKNHIVVMIISKHKETRRSKVVHCAFNFPHICLSIFPLLSSISFYFSPSFVTSLRHTGRCGIFSVDTQRDGISMLIEQRT